MLRLMRSGRWRWTLAALGFIVGCGSTPTAPTPITTTAASTTTTTAVVTTSTAHYAGTITQPAPLPPVPLDLSLFFQVPGGSLRPGVRPQAVNFLVSGGYNTGPGGFSGTIQGTLDGTPDNGTFTGVLTATLANGCIASRNYQGPITQAALDWT